MDINSDIKKRRINYPTLCVLYFKLLFVFIVDYHKPFEQKFIVKYYVTIEVRNNRIVQARRRFNDDVTAEDQKAIDAFNKKFTNKEDKVA